MIGWSVIVCISIAEIVFLGAIFLLLIGIFVAGVMTLMPPSLPKNFNNMPKEEQVRHSMMYNQECADWKNTSKSKRVLKAACCMLFSAFAIFLLIALLFSIL